MSNAAREAFLARVRQAVQQGNRAGQTPPLPERGSVGYQGGGADPVARFCQELAAAGGKAHVVKDDAAVAPLLVELLSSRQAHRILLGQGSVLDRLNLAPALTSAGFEVIRVTDLRAEDCRDPLFAAEAGVSGVAALVAETGSLVVEAGTTESRSLTLLPPLHVAIADRGQLVADLFDLFESPRPMPTGLTLITGPSKTGDIELRLVTGVHGPGEVHVILIDHTMDSI